MEIFNGGVSYVEFSQANYTVQESEESVPAEVTLTRAGNLDNLSGVQINLMGGSAQLNTDYSVPLGLPQSVFFNPGETSQSFIVESTPDLELEGTEEIIFEVTSLDNTVIGSQNSATLNIIDDEIAYVEFSKTTYAVLEGEESVPAEVTLTRSGNLDTASQVQVNVTGGSALLGLDYNTTLGFPELVVFQPGETSKTFVIETLPDIEPEGTEEITFEVTSLDNTVIGNRNNGTLKIFDNDVAYVEFSQATFSVNENETPVQAEITFARAGNLDIISQVQVNVTGGSAELGSDYNLPLGLPQSILFNPGETSQTLVVDILPDLQLEGTEDVSFEIASLGDVVLGTQNTATLQISDPVAEVVPLPILPTESAAII
ncbi:Calx-beta domain-containing protein [Lyngbya aestuarii]|uniref:Calx-beta domain-containing protein n=1 Tax=Lyngbya aestuarii TaxID=118322 RepID=UPI00403D9B3E